MLSRSRAAMLLMLLASSVWLMVNPTGDQPLPALVERATGIGPAQFLAPTERETYESAARDVVRFQGEVDRIDAMEKAARYQATPLSDEEVAASAAAVAELAKQRSVQPAEDSSVKH